MLGYRSAPETNLNKHRGFEWFFGVFRGVSFAIVVEVKGRDLLSMKHWLFNDGILIRFMIIPT